MEDELARPLAFGEDFFDDTNGDEARGDEVQGDEEQGDDGRGAQH